jgi:pyruvate formate lyase activating enzyme
MVLRDQDYYAESGGGITLSGGEPFTQFEGFLALLRQSKEASLHTAVETSGQTATEKLMAAEPFIDRFLLDIKNADGEKLRTVTGADSDLIFGNLAWLGKHCPDKVLARVAVIPGFNFDKASQQAIFQLAKNNSIHTIELLPYHTLGTDKYRQLGRPYPWPADRMLSRRDLLPFAELGENMGLTVILGG